MFYESLCHIRNVTIRLMIFLWVPAVCVAGDRESDKSTRKSEFMNKAEVEKVAIDIVALNKVKIFPVSPDAQINRVIVGGGSDSVAGSSEKLVYSNTLGIRIIQVSPHLLIADDLSLNAPAGCELSRFTFQVVGRANPAHIGGPFRVDYALYEFCPSTGGPVISGTQGFVEFADDYDDAIQQVEIVIPADQSISLLPNIWLGLTTSRDNVGIIMGALPLIGFSEDMVDFPGFACNADIGGFPSFGHASFNTEVFVRDSCPDAYLGYYNAKAFKGGYSAGSGVLIADDIELAVDSCEMVGYEVGVRGPGLYTFSLRVDDNGIPGSIIENTRKLFVHLENNVRVVHFRFSEPKRLDKNLWATFKVNNDVGGWISNESKAIWGNTSKTFFIRNSYGEWALANLDNPSIPDFGGFYLTIHCAGQPPVGACCDMYFGECTGGRDDGDVCLTNDQCKHPGTCEAVCREVPKMNCSFPLRGRTLRPVWMEGFSCDPDPFPFPCGAAACCRPDDTCENLTKNECDDVEPVEDPRRWQIGQYCGEQFQECMYFTACLRREGDCVVAHLGAGCDVPDCCSAVCDADPYCCEVEWDRRCVDTAAIFCDLPPANDDCFDPREGHGALLVGSDSSTVSDGVHATHSENEPGFCCNKFDPGGFGGSTVWYKFMAEHELASLTVTNVSHLDSNPMVQVFSVGDYTNNESACNSLFSIACNDDATFDFTSATYSKIHLKDLIRGETYYVLVASNNFHSSFRLTIESPAINRDAPENDLCEDAIVVTDDAVLIDWYGFNNASSTCPIDDCGKIITHDLWYEYTSNCTGRLFVTSCRPDICGPEIVVLYEGCHCPVSSNDVVMCTGDNNGPCCDNTEPVSIDTTTGQCYKVRIGGSLLTNTASLYNTASHPLLPRFDCVQCDPGEVTWIDPPSGIVDARRPHPFIPCDDDGTCPTISYTKIEGISKFNVSTPPIIHEFCMNTQQTNFNEGLHPKTWYSSTENSVFSLDANENETQTLSLYLKLQSGEITTINYVDDEDGIQTGEFIALPGDVNGDRMVCVNDVHELLDIVKGLKQSVWGNFSADIDHSGSIHPADLLQLIDLMNGAGAYAPWLNATVLTEDAQCPGQ